MNFHRRFHRRFGKRSPARIGAELSRRRVTNRLSFLSGRSFFAKLLIGIGGAFGGAVGLFVVAVVTGLFTSSNMRLQSNLDEESKTNREFDLHFSIDSDIRYPNTCNIEMKIYDCYSKSLFPNAEIVVVASGGEFVDAENTKRARMKADKFGVSTVKWRPPEAFSEKEITFCVSAMAPNNGTFLLKKEIVKKIKISECKSNKYIVYVAKFSPNDEDMNSAIIEKLDMMFDRTEFQVKPINDYINAENKHVVAKMLDNKRAKLVVWGTYVEPKKGGKRIRVNFDFRKDRCDFRKVYNVIDQATELPIIGIGNPREDLDEFSIAVFACEIACLSKFVVGLLYYTDNEWEKALSHFESAAKNQDARRPETAIIHFYIGNALMNMKKIDRAIESYKNAERLKRTFETCRNLGDAYFRRGEHESSIKKIEEAIDILVSENRKRKNHEAVCAEMHLMIGYLYQLQGDLEKAVGEYSKSTKCKGSVAAYNNMGVALINMELRKGGTLTRDVIQEIKAKTFNPATSLEEKNSIVTYNIASAFYYSAECMRQQSIHEYQGMYRRAARKYEEALRYRKEGGGSVGCTIWGYANAIACYIYTGEIEKARGILEELEEEEVKKEARKYVHFSAVIKHHSGKLLEMEGDRDGNREEARRKYKEAICQYKEAIFLYKKDVEFYLSAALLEIKRGNNRSAEGYLRKALENVVEISDKYRRRIEKMREELQDT